MAPDSPRILPPAPKKNFFAGLIRVLTARFRLLLTPLVGILRPVWMFLENKLPSGPRSLVAKNRKVIVLVLVVLVGFWGIRGFLTKKKAKIKLAEQLAGQFEARPEVIPVKVFKVGRFNYEDTLNALGTIKGAMEFKLSFEVPGVLSSINYREGERYEEGALLISLKQDDILLRLKRAQAEMNKADAESSIANRKYEDQKKLFEIGAISPAALDNAKFELDKANYELEATRLEVKANEAMLEKSNLYAPSKGMIGELNIEEGEAISANTLLGTHIMTEFVYAEFGVVERDVNKIQLGQKSRVFVDAYPDKTFEGVIENIAPVVAGKSRTASVRVRLENPENVLLPGMFTRVRLLLYSKKNTLAIPTDSLQGEPGQQFAYVADPAKNVAEKRPITVGYTRPDYTQIDSGISEGELVITSGLEQLEDKKQIKILETQEAEL